jgi:hypothetical protein
MRNHVLKGFLLIAAFLASPNLYAQAGGRVFWRGAVDDKVRLVIRDSSLEQQTVSGQTLPDGVYSFTTPLPDRPVSVQVNKKVGRGTAAVIQQPSSENGFTAIVEIFDPKGGAKDYQLDISWK